MPFSFTSSMRSVPLALPSAFPIDDATIRANDAIASHATRTDRCRLARLGRRAALILGLAAAVSQGAQAAQQATPTDGWQTAWATALQPVPRVAHAPSYNLAPALGGRTLRQVIRVQVAGAQWRLRLSNRYGDRPVSIDAASLAPAGRGAALAGAPLALTFGGARSISLAPGESRLSDPLTTPLRPGPLAISLAIDDKTAAPNTWHKLASQLSYVSSDDKTMDRDAAPFKVGPTSWLFIDALLVDARPPAGVIVAIGDSITDGMRSTLNANARWPDRLAERIEADPATAGRAVVNQGISGNRLLSNSACYGESLTSRFDHDALTLPGSRDIIVLIGINDINFQAMPPRAGLDCDFPHTAVSAADLIAGYRRLIERAHHAGKRIFGATLTPASLPADREAIRLAVNHWMREAPGFDGVVDFDRVLRDPAHPAALQRHYDSGDHIHPSDAGYRAMAEAIPLRFFSN
ncbi:SGNH/GDSL hydrolase family protein [Robbsia sp. KACC 23696]|uniref:SGNH/GDSL hydrolase family protein n=1 Tax=Robbsia sp. KACC 23696 TaxID=3149231 RepID=UPI00325AD4CB